MARMGHDSMHAALIYQHATSDLDRAIAEALNEAFRKLESTEDDDDDAG